MSCSARLGVMEMIVQLPLHINSHFIQRFPFERGHSGILNVKFAAHFNLNQVQATHLGRIANGEEHDQFLIFRPAKQSSQCGATVQRGAKLSFRETVIYHSQSTPLTR